MTTILLTLGRLPKALDLARGFARIGCRVIIAEPFGWHVAGLSRHVARCYRVPPPSAGQGPYLDALADIVARERVDLVVPVSEETMHVAFLAGRVPVFTMPPQAVLALHDKAGFVRHGVASGVAVPETYALGTIAAETLAAARDVVVKPVFSCSGRGVRILRHGAALPAVDPAAPAVVQAFIPGRVLSTCTLARDGRAVATVIYRGTVMSGTVAVAFARVAGHAGIDAWIARFLASTGWTGFIAFDFIEDHDGRVHGIECNPRATSGLHFWHAEDVAQAILDPAAPPVRFRPDAVLQQFYACLTETQMALFRGGGFAGHLRRLLSTRDVTWDWRDPLPFLAMTPASWRIIAMAMARGVPFGEVATLDVGWYGALSAPPAPAPACPHTSAETAA